MNPFYAEYIATAKTLAKDQGLNWNLICDDQGKVSRDTRWNLTGLVGMLPPPTIWLGQIGVDRNSFVTLNEIRQRMHQALLVPGPMPQAWRDLYQAVLIDQLLMRRTKPLSAMKIAVPIRQLAPVAGDTPPWAVTPDQVQQAYNATLQGQESGKVALDFTTMVRNILDGQKLADTPALARFCVPYATEESQAAQERANAIQMRQNAHGGRKGLRRELAERKSASKLPDERRSGNWCGSSSRRRPDPSRMRSDLRPSRFRSSWASALARLPSFLWTGSAGGNTSMPMDVLPESVAASHAR